MCKLTGKSVREAIIKKDNEMRPTTKGELFKGKLKELSELELIEKLEELIEFYENTGFMEDDEVGFEL